MSRGLSAGQLTVLNRQTSMVEDLVEITLWNAGSTVYKYTTGASDFSGSGLVPGTWYAKSFISAITTPEESYELRSIPIVLTFEKFTSENYTTPTSSREDNFIVNLQNSSWTNSSVVVWKLLRDPSTNAADTTDGVFKIFDGKITNLAVKYSTQSVEYQLTCMGQFPENRPRGRTTGDIFGALNGKKLYWGTITKI